MGGSMLEPKEAAEAEIEIKKSRFIALAQRVSGAEEVRRRIKETRELHPGANHVVHAFVTSGGDIFGMSDDREPKGTAGRPVLEVVRGSGIDNLLVMVVRYFGGTKLGTGGLVKAYTEAAQAVLKVLPTRPLIESISFRVVLSYDQYEPIKKSLDHCSWSHRKRPLWSRLSSRARSPARMPIGLRGWSARSVQADQPLKFSTRTAAVQLSRL